METTDLIHEVVAALDDHTEADGHDFEIDDFHPAQGWVVVKVTGRAGADAGAFRIDIREITITD